MNNRRDHRASKSALFDSFDGIEEGGLRASSSYSSDISEHDNDKAIDSLKDRVVFLKGGISLGTTIHFNDDGTINLSNAYGACELGSGYPYSFDLYPNTSPLKVSFGDIHDEVLNHNRLLDGMGNDMDASRGVLSGTVDRFKMVFESKSGRKMCKLVGYFVLTFLVFYFLYRVMRHI